jgi:hypothetical protein
MTKDPLARSTIEDKLIDLHQRSGSGEMLADDIGKLAAEFGANIAVNVKLFPGTDKTPVVGCVIDPATGQCVNYFTVPDPSGHILATILRHGSSS